VFFSPSALPAKRKLLNDCTDLPEAGDGVTWVHFTPSAPKVQSITWVSVFSLLQLWNHATEAVN
jgi:hypothetical protein